MTFVTTQIAPLAANAGNAFTQNVSVGGAGGVVGNPNQTNAQSGPGWATVDGGPVASTASSSSSSTNWGVVALLLAAAYFGFRKTR
jgi:hypothetical protein